MRICETVKSNPDASAHDAGRLSPKRRQGMAWCQRQPKRALDFSSSRAIALALINPVPGADTRDLGFSRKTRQL